VEGEKVTCGVRETGGPDEVDGPGEIGGLESAGGLEEAYGPDVISVSREIADSLRAEVGDIVYVSDARWWLGGLRSVHAKLSAIRDDGDNTVHLSSSLRAEGSLQVRRRHTIEKIF
jgi:hypothetical protein